MTETCELLGISKQCFSQTWRKHMPAEAFRAAGKNTLAHLPSIIAAWVDHRVNAARSTAPESSNDESWTADSADADAARYRRAKADLTEQQALKASRENEERAGSHVSLVDFDGFIARLATVLRGAAENVQRKFGGEAGQTWNEALDDALEQWKRSRVGRRAAGTAGAGDADTVAQAVR
jgi:phage terminase Nu1 subunit (DNA packaging protein)